jgi:probable rRNA maturation factor
MIELEINNQTQARIPRQKLVDLLKFTNKKLKIKKKSKLSLAFVSPAQIKKLNKQYRKKDQVTDVLSFEETGFPDPENSIGEIIICSVRATSQAKEFNHSFAKEVVRLTLHGYLHLLGYDHVKNKEAEVMEALEEKIMKEFYA